MPQEILIGYGIPIAVTDQECEIKLVEDPAADVTTYRLCVGEFEHEDWTGWRISITSDVFWQAKYNGSPVSLFGTPESGGRFICNTGISLFNLRFV